MMTGSSKISRIFLVLCVELACMVTMLPYIRDVTRTMHGDQNSMTTTLKEIRYGIEIETMGATRERVAEAIKTVVGGRVEHPNGPACYDAWQVVDATGRKWKVTADSSICAPRHLQAEVVSPVLTYSDLPNLQEVVRAVRRAGARVNESCGIHIHIDASPFEARTLTNFAKLVYKQEPLIFRALGVSQRRQGTYTRPMDRDFMLRLEADRPETMEDLNEDWYGRVNSNPTHYDNTRYHGTNFHNVWYRGTVEFRYFEATLHAGEVKAYIHLCLAMAAKALNARAAVSEQRTYNEASAKYDFRCFLLRLKLNGKEFKNTRMHLLKRMPGSAAWKHGRPTTTTTNA